jgi:DNA transformation protein and related proteins
MHGLGPASARMLREAGITKGEQLREIGAAEAFARVQFLNPSAVSLNLLWALHGAIYGVDWRSIDESTKARLKAEVGLKH